ncbi:cobalamin-binding protein [Sulfuricaulis sp.]|uniref:cobalamin-binding protein n=1 Tax=Sulfuricaulis sp. TaxID=2003553 RepID=UPI003559FAA5
MPDDAGRMLTLVSPARRIVSLAPNVTELLYVAGAGNFVVGAVAYSDYPEAAKSIPRVGSGAGLDVEAIVALHPDLVIAWQSGNPSWQVERLISLGMPVFVTEPRHLDDMVDLLERLGKLAGTEALAGKTAADFRRHLARLRARYSGRPVVPVFYQILDSSLLTVSRRHLINDVIQLCGGRNIYADLPGLTPRVDMESVVQRNPEVILASGYDALWQEWRDRWRALSMLTASTRDNLLFIPPDLIERQSLRILDGSERICATLEQARAKRKVSGSP